MERDDFLDGIHRMRSEIEALFEGFFRLQHPIAITRGHLWRPPTDCYETESHIVVIMDLAGVAAEDVKIAVTNRALTVRGTRRDLTPLGSRRNYHKMEMDIGDFEGVVPIWCHVDVEKVETSLDRGILVVKIPKLPHPGAEPKTVSIE
jgi:HSP20 family protein